MHAVMDRVEYFARGETVRLYKRRTVTVTVAADAQERDEEA